MADWKNLSEDIYLVEYKDKAGSDPSGNVKVTLQYDNDSKTPTSCKFRFKLNRRNSVHYNDSMYIIYNPNDDPESISPTLYKLKSYQSYTASGNEDPHDNASWPYYSKSFTITKSYNAAAFYIQDIWICNNGNTATSVSLSNFLSKYASNGTRADWALRQSGGQYLQDSDGKGISGTVAAAANPPTISITDHYNNTFTITATAPAATSNNPVNGLTNLKWGYSTKYENSYAATNGQPQTLSYDGTKAQREVFAKATTDAQYGTDPEVKAKRSDGTEGVLIRQYMAPGAPGKPEITYQKHGKKPTLKENGVWRWTSSPKRGYSNVKGYYIYLYKKRKNSTTEELVPIMSVSNPDEYCSEQWTHDDITEWVYWRPTDKTDGVADETQVMPFSLKNCGFEVGDQFKLCVQGYCEDGTGKDYLSARVDSDWYTVKSAGIVRVKTSDGWKEGQVWVKTADGWKEASSVLVKTSDGWKESQ